MNVLSVDLRSAEPQNQRKDALHAGPTMVDHKAVGSQDGPCPGTKWAGSESPLAMGNFGRNSPNG